MVVEKIMVKESRGICLDSATKLCKESNKYKSKIHIRFKDGIFNAKSILSVLSASLSLNDEFELICEGIDEKEALENLKNYF